MKQSRPFLQMATSNQVDDRACLINSRLPTVSFPGHEASARFYLWLQISHSELGNLPINVSKDENLTHLDSFNRDRPKGCRDIPSWNLSLVLHQLKKASFESQKEASLKHLTLGTAFLLAFGSDKCRSEIHA